jgi:hypothetical protein
MGNRSVFAIWNEEHSYLYGATAYHRPNLQSDLMTQKASLQLGRPERCATSSLRAPIIALRAAMMLASSSLSTASPARSSNRAKFDAFLACGEFIELPESLIVGAVNGHVGHYHLLVSGAGTSTRAGAIVMIRSSLCA